MKILIGQAYTRNLFPFNIGALLIKWAQGTNYSHYWMHTEGHFIDASIRGVEVSGIQSFSDHYHWSNHACWEVDLDCDAFQFSVWLNKHTGKKYSYLQNLGLWLMDIFCFSENPFPNGKKSFNCTELVVGAVIEFAGLNLADKSPEDYDLNETEKFLKWLQLQGVAKRIR